MANCFALNFKNVNLFLTEKDFLELLTLQILFFIC